MLPCVSCFRFHLQRPGVFAPLPIPRLASPRLLFHPIPRRISQRKMFSSIIKKAKELEQAINREFEANAGRNDLAGIRSSQESLTPPQRPQTSFHPGAPVQRPTAGDQAGVDADGGGLIDGPIMDNRRIESKEKSKEFPPTLPSRPATAIPVYSSSSTDDPRRRRMPVAGPEEIADTAPTIQTQAAPDPTNALMEASDRKDTSPPYQLKDSLVDPPAEPTTATDDRNTQQQVPVPLDDTYSPSPNIDAIGSTAIASVNARAEPIPNDNTNDLRQRVESLESTLNAVKSRAKVRIEALQREVHQVRQARAELVIAMERKALEQQSDFEVELVALRAKITEMESELERVQSMKNAEIQRLHGELQAAATGRSFCSCMRLLLYT